MGEPIRADEHHAVATTTATSSVDPSPACAIGRRFVEAVANRDEDTMAELLTAEVHLRALLPGGIRELDGAGKVIGAFRRWFGDATSVELVDTAAEDLGECTHLSWRLRVLDPSRPAGAHLVEQQIFAVIGDRIERIDLLCSGFHLESEARGS